MSKTAPVCTMPHVGDDVHLRLDQVSPDLRPQTRTATLPCGCITGVEFIGPASDHFRVTYLDCRRP